MVYCKICSTKTINDNELCKFCQKKRKAAQIILRLQDKITFKEKFNNSLLFNLGYEDKKRNQDIIWTLEDSTVIKEISKEEYKWIDIDLIKKFVKKYDEKNGQDLKISNATVTENQKKCLYCGRVIPQFKKKQKLCKECKKTKKTLKNIKFIASFEDSLNIDKIMDETSKEKYQVEAALFDLVDNNLIKQIDENNYQKILDKIDKYLKEHEDIYNKINQQKTEKVIKTSSTKEKNKEKVHENTKNMDGNINRKTMANTEVPDKKESKPLFIPRKENPSISIIQPAGWILYEKITGNRFKLSEYKLLTGISLKSKRYKPSKVFILNDFENVKWIKNLNKYYIYTKDQVNYENIKLYTSDDIEREIKNYDESVNSSQINISKKEKIITDDIIGNQKNIPSNEEVFNEFFDKNIAISEDEKSWITYDRLLKLFNEYVYMEYKIKIPELGENGFNKLLYSKIKKISGIKTKNINSTMEFNLIYDKNENDKNNDSNDNIETIDVKHQENNRKTDDDNAHMLNQIAEVNELLSKYLNENLKIVDREANSNDLSQKDIYVSFVEYLSKDNKSVSYALFAYSFQRIVNNTRGIEKKIIDKKVYYNIIYKKPIKGNKKPSKNITKTTQTEKTTHNIENVKSNYEIFDEFFEKHLETTTDNQWINKQRLYTLFNNYALNNYNVEISQHGVNGFNSILQTRNIEIDDIKKRIRNGQIEYNVKYYSSKQQDNIDKSRIYVTDYEYKSTDESEIEGDLEFKRFKEYSDNHIRVLDNEVEEYDVTKDEIYDKYKEYYQEKYDEKLEYANFESAFVKYISEGNDINTLLKDNVIHYNLEIVDNLEVDESDVDEDISTDFKSNKKAFDDFWENHIEVTDENKTKRIDKIYESFKEYALNKYGLNIKDDGSYGFNRLVYLKKNEEEQLISKTIGKKVLYNIQYVSNKDNETEPQNITTSKSLNNEENDEEPVEITQQKEILHKLRYYLNNNMLILNRKPSLTDLTDCDIFTDFKTYLLEKHNEFISFNNFKIYLIKVLNNYPNIDFVTEDNQLHLNLKFIDNDTVNIDAQRRIKSYEIIDSTLICQYLENKNINKLENEEESIIIYNEVIDYSEYRKLMSMLNESIELVDQLNVTSLHEDKLNVNLILRIIKEDK